MQKPFGLGVIRGILLPALALGCLSSCWSPEGRVPAAGAVVAGLATQAAVLTKDDVLLVDGTRLSLTGFYNLRDRFPDLTRDQMLWAATACLAFQNDARRQGRELTLEVPVQMVRYVLGKITAAQAESALREFFGSASGSYPSAEALRKDLEQMIARSVVQKNIQVLAEIH